MFPLDGLVMEPPTEGMLARLSYVKWCVLVTYLCAVGRFLADDPFGALNDLFGALFGTFLLREDPALQFCYRCLHESPIGAMSEGGMNCLLPYTFMAALNGVFSSVRVYTILVKYGTLLPCTQKLLCYLGLPTWLSLSAIAQTAAVCLCWTVYKQMQRQTFSGTMDAYGDFLSQQPGELSGVHVENGPPRYSFVPYQGRGHCLVDSDPEEGI